MDKKKLRFIPLMVLRHNAWPFARVEGPTGLLHPVAGPYRALFSYTSTLLIHRFGYRGDANGDLTAPVSML